MILIQIFIIFFFLMIRRPPRSTLDRSSAASDVYKRQVHRVSTKSVAIQAIAASTTVLGRTLVYRDVLVGLLQCVPSPLLCVEDPADVDAGDHVGGAGAALGHNAHSHAGQD